VPVENRRIRVLYSFPHKLGADRICYTALQQVKGLAAAQADVLVFPGAVCNPAPEGVKLQPTLARGKFRIPCKAIGSLRAFALHDYIVARRIEKMADRIDIIHTWPLGALRTLQAARKLGIPTVLERPNAHTRFAYEVVQEECERLGVALPPDHEHAYKPDVLRIEEEEYRLADYLLCPSEFTARTFLERGFPEEKLARHFYGFDEKAYYPSSEPRKSEPGLTILFVGVCAVRKGLHFALDAWLKSPVHRDGSFLIAGEFLPAYKDKLASMLSHPSVHVLGHRNDVADLMRKSDILVLPSIEEGFGLVCTEAMGTGCVPVVSDACTDICRHLENGLVHRVGDVQALTNHLTMLYQDRALLERLRRAALSTAPTVTWDAAGVRLLQIYSEVLAKRTKNNALNKVYQ
jgi:glycosyltransferase involved in cell wall biosynthesis